MKTLDLSVPQLAFIIITRAALAAGVGMLLASGLRRRRRRQIGRVLLATGGLTTIPAAFLLASGAKKAREMALRAVA